MDCSTLATCSLFAGVPEEDLRGNLDAIPHRVQRFGKGEAIFRLMEPADRIGVILEGRVQAQKPFPNGSQVNVSVRNAGELIGPAAAFSKSQRYPCDVVALEPSAILMLRKEDLLTLMQRDVRIMTNLMTELATTTYMLQQRLELLSYSGIAQKAAFYLLVKETERAGPGHHPWVGLQLGYADERLAPLPAPRAKATGGYRGDCVPPAHHRDTKCRGAAGRTWTIEPCTLISCIE